MIADISPSESGRPPARIHMVFTNLLLSFALLLSCFFEATSAAELVDKQPKQVSFKKSLKDALKREKVVFPTKPPEAELFVPLPEKPVASDEVFAFNPYMAHIPLEREYFEMFCFLYPGLKGVPIRPADVHGLILFGVLHSIEDDDSINFADRFVEFLRELSEIFVDEKTEIVFSAEYLESKAAAMHNLFIQALRAPLILTRTARIAVQKETPFTREKLFFAMKSAKEKGENPAESAIVNRIASELFFCTDRLAFTAPSKDVTGVPCSFLVYKEGMEVHNFPVEAIGKRWYEFNLQEKLGEVTCGLAGKKFLSHLVFVSFL